jgi:hypothetical protein
MEQDPVIVFDNKPVKSNFKKKLFFFSVFVVIVLVGFAYWFVFQRNAAPPATSAQVTQQITLLSSVLPDTFPAISRKTAISPEQLPKSLDLFVNDKAVGEKYFIISYGKNQSGHLILYNVPDTTVQQVQSDLFQKLFGILGQNGWFSLSSAHTASVGVTDLEERTAMDRGRGVFVQAGNTVRVSVLTISKVP